jgi:hypothetical protein
MKIIVLLISLLLSNITIGSTTSQGKVIIKDIAKLIKNYKQSPSPKLLEQTLNKYIELYKFDKSHYSYEMLYPIFNKYKKNFNAALKKLPPKQRSIIILNIEGFQEEQTTGNDL